MNGVERVIETVLVKGGNRMSVRAQPHHSRLPAAHSLLAFLAMEVRDQSVEALVMGV